MPHNSSTRGIYPRQSRDRQSREGAAAPFDNLRTMQRNFLFARARVRVEYGARFLQPAEVREDVGRKDEAAGENVQDAETAFFYSYGAVRGD